MEPSAWQRTMLRAWWASIRRVAPSVMGLMSIVSSSVPSIRSRAWVGCELVCDWLLSGLMVLSGAQAMSDRPVFQGLVSGLAYQWGRSDWAVVTNPDWRWWSEMENPAEPMRSRGERAREHSVWKSGSSTDDVRLVRCTPADSGMKRAES